MVQALLILILILVIFVLAEPCGASLANDVQQLHHEIEELRYRLAVVATYHWGNQLPKYLARGCAWQKTTTPTSGSTKTTNRIEFDPYCTRTYIQCMDTCIYDDFWVKRQPYANFAFCTEKCAFPSCIEDCTGDAIAMVLLSNGSIVAMGHSNGLQCATLCKDVKDYEPYWY
jgi:hypothetical protein